MSSWIVRGGPAGRWEQYALDEGVTAVGWSTIGDLSTVGSKEELQGILDEAGVDEQARKTTMLWSFVREMAPGDLVVMPRAGEQVVAIGEVSGDYRHDSTDPDARQVRDVSWLDTGVSKLRFAADLRTYFDLPSTLTAIRKARAPDARLRQVATTELPDGFEPGGPLSEFPRPVPFRLDELVGVPDAPSVHLVWSPEGELLYVGYTGGPLRQRLSHHVRGDRQASMLHQRVGELLDEKQGSSVEANEIGAFLATCTIAWGTVDDPEALKEQLVSLLTPRFSGKATGRAYWWVNQGQSYDEERAGGLMWAPLQNEKGTTYRYWSALKDTRPGDLVYHYAGGVIRAVGLVAQPAREAPKPITSDAWQGTGYLVEVEYLDLDEPIPLDDIPLEWRLEEAGGGPFNVKGGVKMGYLFPLTTTFARRLADQLGDRLPGEPQAPPETPSSQVWLFQGNPTKWPIEDMLEEASPGDQDSWAVNQQGDRMSAGDMVLFWVSGSEAGIYGLAQLDSGPYDLDSPDEFGATKVDFHWVDILDEPLWRDDLRNHPVLKDLGVLRFPQQTNYAVTNEQWEAIQELTGWQEPEPMTMDWLEEETLWDRARLEELVTTLTDETYQVVMAGPPGTGKTYVAELVAQYITGNYPGALRLVQFHPSYSYEEFIEGLRPVAEDGAVDFRVEPGVVVDMCSYIDPEADQFHVLIIDEMNRANLSSVFGELMYLFEYRDREINLRFTPRFALPSTLRIIGTMNTADRSARSIDIALRRRFDVFECPPSRNILERFYKKTGNTNHVPSLLDGFDRLNGTLTDLRDRHHTIGHTFFMASDLTVERLRHVWEHKILPLLEEYFLDQPDQVAKFELASFWPETAVP